MLLARCATPVMQFRHWLPSAACTLVGPFGVAAIGTPCIEEASVGECGLEAEEGRGGSVESGKDFDSGKAATEGTVELGGAEEFAWGRLSVLYQILDQGVSSKSISAVRSYAPIRASISRQPNSRIQFSRML